MSDALFKIIPNCTDKSSIVHVSENKFSYTNNFGNITNYLIFISYISYKKGISTTPHKLHRANSFYIAELI